MGLASINLALQLTLEVVKVPIRLLAGHLQAGVGPLLFFLRLGEYVGKLLLKLFDS